MHRISLASILVVLLGPSAFAGGTTEFCLHGMWNLGAQMQGHMFAEELVPTSWCVVTEDDTNRVRFSMTGKSNTDMEGDWTVVYMPPNTVRIVNRDSPPDIEFQNTGNLDEALRIRRLDPRRLAEELGTDPDQAREFRQFNSVDVIVENGRIKSVENPVPLPYFGAINVGWYWNWADPEHPQLSMGASEESFGLFEATGTWRDVPDLEAADIWRATPGADPVEVPGDRWPARINMRLIELSKDVYLVRGVRTGFQHLVVDTDDGLVIADAPTGWTEFHQIPFGDLVPGLGTDGLSIRLIEFLNEGFSERPIHAVALTHFHSDHAGGAPAFAAAGAKVFAPAESSQFMNRAFADRGRRNEVDYPPFEVLPVNDVVELGNMNQRLKLISLGKNPHVFEMLGVWVVDAGYFFVSDVHVPRGDDNSPSRERAATECWFAVWAVENLPPNVRVLNSHSASETPVSRLAKYVQSDTCRSLP